MEQGTRYSTWRDYYLILQGFFYGSQGIAYGIALFLPAYMRSFGLEESKALGFQAIILLPWYIKFLFGLVSDNVAFGSYGRRKPYVLIAAVIGLLGWLTLPLYSSYSIMILVSGMAAALGIALADASIDALAVDITPPHRRSSMQGVSWGFRAIGFGSATLFAGSLVEQEQWVLLFLIPGILSTFSSLLMLLLREIPLPDDFSYLPRQVYKQVLGHRAIGLTMIFQILSGAAIAILFILETFLSNTLGYSASDIGVILFSLGLGMFAGALLLGISGDRMAFSKLMTGLTLVYVMVIAGVFLIDLGDLTQVIVYFVAIGFINGGYEATQMRMGMDYSPPVMGGTMFNFYNSLSNIGQIAIGPLLVYAIIETTPVKVGWQFFSVFLILALLLVLYIRSRYKPLEIATLGDEVILQI